MTRRVRTETRGSGITEHEVRVIENPTVQEVGAVLKRVSRMTFDKQTAEFRAACQIFMEGKDRDNIWVDSREDYADGFLKRCDYADRAIEEGDADAAARWAFAAGQTMTAAILKWNWDDVVDHAKKLRGANSGPQKKTEARKQFLKRIASEQGLTNRKEIARAALDDPGRSDLFPADFGKILNFANSHKI